MPIVQNQDVPVAVLPRAKRRLLAAGHLGATETTVFEQWLHASGYIPLHYHDVEEIVVILQGIVEVTMGSETRVLQAPVTLIVPREQLHAIKPARGSEMVYLLAAFPSVSPKMFLPDGTEYSSSWQDAQMVHEKPGS